MTNAEENCEMIWKMWKKRKLNSEKMKNMKETQVEL